MKKFQEMLFKDFGWKIFSIAIATILWFMVINIDQPVDTRNYSTPLTIANMETLTERGLAVGNLEELKNTKINVKVKAQRTALDRLSQNPEWITATVDLSQLPYVVTGDTVALPVMVSIQGGNTYGISSRSPSVVEVTIETMASKELPVEVILNGKLDEGTYLSDPMLSAETVLVTGPASLVDDVVSVRATVEAESIKESSEVQAELICYNKDGLPVKGVSTNIEEVLVSYTMHDMKMLPIQVDISGTPAAGYQVGSIRCNPQYASVTGSAEDLEKITYLQLDHIDVSGRNAAVTQTFRLSDYLPKGLSLLTSENSVVEVTVDISKQSQKQLTLPASELRMLGLEDGKEYIPHGDARITISGDSSALDAIHADTLQGTIYVNNLSVGDHRVMVHTDLPDGLIMNPSYITLTVKDAEPSAE